MVGKLHDGRLMSLWTGFQELLGSILRFFHDATVMVFGDHAWLVAIVLLTVAVRVLLTPLAIKQFRSMQAMQQLRPQMKEIQDRYKTDRSMIRTDPEKYRAQRQKQQEELMALYQEHNVNPASSCLPLLVQAPILFGLFTVLRSPDVVPELVNAPFAFGATLQEVVRTAGPLAYALLLVMGITMFVQQRQMMARNTTAAAADDQTAQIQKMMLYVMPVVLVVTGVNFPVGVVIYWATTNLWQVGQQWYILREVAETTPTA
jgi:YidC/Oxa1 family membrane protein insertase